LWDSALYGSRNSQKEYVVDRTHELRRLMNNCRAAGHGKPVDIWAMGVITYFLLAGYRPFDRENQQLGMQAIIAGDYKFEPGMF